MFARSARQFLWRHLHDVPYLPLIPLAWGGGCRSVALGQPLDMPLVDESCEAGGGGGSKSLSAQRELLGVDLRRPCEVRRRHVRHETLPLPSLFCRAVSRCTLEGLQVGTVLLLLARLAQLPLSLLLLHLQRVPLALLLGLRLLELRLRRSVLAHRRHRQVVGVSCTGHTWLPRRRIHPRDVPTQKPPGSLSRRG